MTKNYAAAVFTYAKKLGIINANPMDNVTMPKKFAAVGEEKELNFYSKDELQQFFEGVQKDADRIHSMKWLALFRVLAFTGMRKVELLSLTWNDIDFSNETVSINKTLSRGLNNRLLVQTPKTSASRRTIVLDKVTLSILKEWRKHQAMDYLKLGFNTMNSTQLIFPNTKNEYMSPTKPGQKLTSLIKEYDLKTISIHGFRHTHVSLLLESGATIKAVQERVGHSDIQTTMNIYAKVTKHAKEKTAEEFAQYVNF